jgi:hypothetical protein
MSKYNSYQRTDTFNIEDFLSGITVNGELRQFSSAALIAFINEFTENGAGVVKFIDLTDVIPNNYNNSAGKFVAVNQEGTGLEFVEAPEQEVIEVEDAEQFNPTKPGGYSAGEFVSYRNEASLDVQFQTFAIYLAQYDILMGVSPEDDPIGWEWQGTELILNNSTTSVISVVGDSENSIRLITGYANGHGIIGEHTGILYRYSSTAASGLPCTSGDIPMIRCDAMCESCC